MTEKDKKIIEDAEREGIPIFVLTAKDFNAPFTLRMYQQACSFHNCNESHIDGIEKRIAEFKDWQYMNIERVKLPD